jgi:hypothetical protein
VIVMVFVKLRKIVLDRLLFAKVFMQNFDNDFDRFVSPSKLPVLVFSQGNELGLS